MRKASAATALIIPVYNEAKVIREVIERASKQFQAIVCIDDGSKDGSLEEIKKTTAFYLEHPINMGQGAALQTGIEFARQLKGIEYFVTFDADGQHRVEDVLTMLETLQTGKYDIVLGSRFLGSVEGMTRAKKVMFKMAIRFSNLTTGLKLTDTHNGLRAFTRRVAEEMQITFSDMTHASEILEIVAHKKYRYKEIPVTIEYTDYSKSKGQSVINAVNIGFDTILRKISK